MEQINISLFGEHKVLPLQQHPQRVDKMPMRGVEVHPRRYYLKSERYQEKLNAAFLEQRTLLMATESTVYADVCGPAKKARLSKLMDEDLTIASSPLTIHSDSSSCKSGPYTTISPKMSEERVVPNTFGIRKSITLNDVQDDLVKPKSFWGRLKMFNKRGDVDKGSNSGERVSNRHSDPVFPGKGAEGPPARPTSLNFKFLSDTKLHTSIRSLLQFRSGKSQSATESPGTTSSLNSLNDGRVPWPVPWLEAIFLPEFPNRGHLNEKQFYNDGIIAKGKFSTVYKVALKVHAESKFAMKVQKKSDVLNQNAVEQVKDELRIHVRAKVKGHSFLIESLFQQALSNHSFIAQMYASWQSRSNLYMVLHYVSGYGDMYEYWRFENPLPPKLVQFWTAELGNALDFIHKKGVIYRDLKMENIVLDDRANVKLIDFGLAKWLRIGKQTTTICGTLCYMAPEILTSTGYSHSVDWWSLGVLVHSLVTGKYPFEVTEQRSVQYSDEYSAPKTVCPKLQRVLEKVVLLERNPLYRLCEFSALLREPYFDDLPLERLLDGSLSPADEIYKFKPKADKQATLNDIAMDEECVDDYKEEYFSSFFCFDYEDSQSPEPYHY